MIYGIIGVAALEVDFCYAFFRPLTAIIKKIFILLCNIYKKTADPKTESAVFQIKSKLESGRCARTPIDYDVFSRDLFAGRDDLGGEHYVKLEYLILFHSVLLYI